ncbi:MAG: GNAT family N-acetyltransferase [Thermoanaerobaculia bacterium]
MKRAFGVRLAERSDLAALARLWAREGGEGGAGEERMTRYFDGLHHPRQALAPRVFFLAEADGAAIGYVAGHLTRRFGCDGELQWLFVGAEHRRHGVATRLVRRLAEWFAAQGAARICVDVAPANVDARRFYLRRGAEALDEHWLVWRDVRALAGETDAPRRPAVEVAIEEARASDAPALAALHAAVAADLVARLGPGPWSGAPGERGIARSIRSSRVLVARAGSRIAGTLELATRKPWAIDRAYFTPVCRPLYLVHMAVAPQLQRAGVGRRLIEAAQQAALAHPAEAIWLDAYDGPPTADEFYRRCAFREVGRASYRGTPLVYLEWLAAEPRPST